MKHQNRPPWCAIRWLLLLSLACGCHRSPVDAPRPLQTKTATVPALAVSTPLAATTEASASPLASPESASNSEPLSRVDAWPNVEDGVVLLEWKPVAPGPPGDDPYTSPPRGTVRVGVWSPTTKAFTSVMREPVLALAASAHAYGTVLLVSGNRALELRSNLLDVQVNSVGLASEQNESQQLEEPYAYPDRLELFEVTGGWRFRAHLKSTSQPGQAEWSNWKRIGAGAAGAPTDAAYPTLTVLAEGSLLTGVPTGWKLEGIELKSPKGEAYRLPPEQAKAASQLVVLTPAGPWLVSTEFFCTWEGKDPEPVLRHFVDRFETNGRRVRIHSGPGAAALRVIADGRVLMQVAEETRLLAPQATTWNQGLRLAKGLVLVVPMEPKYCREL